jgi:serine/threonine protein kinase
MPLIAEGARIRDTIEVERFIGEGAFAEVYRVRHRFLGRQAMKLFKRVGMTLAEIEEMLGEAILLSRIGHPNIIRVFDANVFETAQGIHGYFTMENVPGGCLDRFWRSHGPNLVPLATSVEIIRQICRGLAVAHEESPPIVHRDIKPTNVLIGYEADGLRARLSDFGLARRVNPLTLLATAAGTLPFKPPEVFTDTRSDSCAADVWALGVTFYLLLTDRLPFAIDPDLGWSNKKAFEKPPVAPTYWNPQLDPALERTVLRCLEIDPSERFQTAKELLTAIESASSSASPKERRPTLSTSAEGTKAALGQHSPPDREGAQRLVRLALDWAHDVRRLTEAADLMEEAFNESPSLREKYEDRVQLWRRGISL